MQNFFKYIVCLLLFTSPFNSFSQRKGDNTGILSSTLANIKRDGSEKFFSVLNPMLKSPKNRGEELNAIYFSGLYHQNYTNKGDSTIHYGNKLIDLVKSKKDSLSLVTRAKSYILLAAGNAQKGLYNTAKGFSLKGLDLHEKGQVSDSYTLTYLMHGLAISHTHFKEYDKALELYKKCIDLNINNGILYGSYINIGVIYGKQKKYNESIEYFKKSISLIEHEGINYKAQATSYSNIGASYRELENLDEALNNYKKALAIAEKYDFEIIKLVLNINIGEIYYDKKEFEKALSIYNISLEKTKKLKLIQLEKELYNYLKDTYQAKGDYKSALSYETLRLNIIDSIKNVQKSKEINELEVKYRTFQKEKEIELLKKDQLLKSSELTKEKNTKTTLLISFLIILIPSIALLFMYYQKLTIQNQLNKKHKEINQQKITTLIKDQELLLIEASIEGQYAEKKRIAQELHDSIGGNLAAIKLQFGNIDNGEKIYKTITKQIDETYNQVRTISHDLVPKKFSKNSFISVIKEYMKNIGSASKLNIICNAFPEDEINSIDEQLQVEIFKMLQELITNTIKHAKASEVEIQLNHLDGSINVLFEDNGIGFNSKKAPEGIGFTNIKSRLQKIDGFIQIDSRYKRGTIIDIEIPIKTIISNEV